MISHPPPLLRHFRRQRMAPPSFPPLRRIVSSPSLLRAILLLSAAVLLLFCLLLFPNPLLRPYLSGAAPTAVADPTSPRHILFGIASSARSWPRRKPYVRLWWRPGLMRGAVFLDSPVARDGDEAHLPPVRVSADTSRFPYSFVGGLRSAIRIARIVKELVDGVAANGLSDTADIRWVVLGDDDTVFFPDSLAGVLAKYDWRQWYYVGGRSESVEQNAKHSFSMAYGGGGFAISYPLAKVLARVLDSCIVRYAHLFGSDDRIFSCLTELGVGLTSELGFHQVDVRGDIFGILAAHPMTTLVSLHHVDHVEPVFPGMTRVAALKHLLKAADVDPGRILQQTVCYDSLNLLTVSVSWGYVVQVFEGNQLLLDLLSVPQTFTPWKRGRGSYLSSSYMFNTRLLDKDACKSPDVYFLDSVLLNKERVQSNYTRHATVNCEQRKSSSKDLKNITVSSHQLNHQPAQAVRRDCCEVLQTSSKTAMEIVIRKCKDDELISMHG